MLLLKRPPVVTLRMFFFRVYSRLIKNGTSIIQKDVLILSNGTLATVVGTFALVIDFFALTIGTLTLIIDFFALTIRSFAIIIDFFALTIRTFPTVIKTLATATVNVMLRVLVLVFLTDTILIISQICGCVKHLNA